MARRKKPPLEDLDVATGLGEYEVAGYRVGDTIAVTRVLEAGKKEGTIVYGRGWTVTHLPTGRTFGQLNERQKVAFAVAQAMIDLGFDSVVTTDPGRARTELARAGGSDLIQRYYHRMPPLTDDRAVAWIEEYVQERLGGAPPRYDKRAAKLVPAARGLSPRRRPPAKPKEPAAPKKPPKRGKKGSRQPAEPTELDLISMASRIRGNNPCSPTQPLW